MTQHSSLTATADIHVCKGADTAAVGKTIVFDGTGGQSALYANPHGGIYFTDIGSPNTVTNPTSYTKVNPTTIAAGTNVEFTEGTNARLTYTGTATLDTKITAHVCISETDATVRDVTLALYKNGSIVTGAERVVTCTDDAKTPIDMDWSLPLATNDYLELYIKISGGTENISVYTYSLAAIAMRG